MTVVIRPTVQQSMEATAKAKGLELGRDRLEAMKPQCGFGELGTCCRICYMGPCRIDPFGDGPKKGICGLSADTMVARNLLRETIGGAASHVGHARHLVLTLRDALTGAAPYEIRGEDKAFAVAKQFGVPTEGRTAKEVCLDLVNIALEDFGRQDGKLNNWLSKRAPAKELEMWQNLGIAYSNPHNEIETAMHATSMGNDADPVTLLLRTLKLGLVDGWTGLALCTDIQDILFGTPQVTVVESSAGVLKENSVNIATHGHNPVLSEKILEWAGKLAAEATAAGAESMNVVGVCCTGNELGMRHGVPLAAHNAQSELILATGAVDAMVVDIQCIWPSLPQLAACFDTAFITTDEMVHIPGATHIEFEPHTADESAQKVVRMAIASFVKRRGKKVDIPNVRTTAVAGLSVEAIVGILSKVNAEDPLKPVIDNVVAGNIRGFAGVVGCSSVKFRDSEMTEKMVKELLANDVLVVTTGCTAHICAQDSLLTSEATDILRAGPESRAGRAGQRRRAGQAAAAGVAHGQLRGQLAHCRSAGRCGRAAGRQGQPVAGHRFGAGAGAGEGHFHRRFVPGAGDHGACGATSARAGRPMVTPDPDAGSGGITGAKDCEYDPIKAAAAMIAHINEKRAGLGLS
jgi:carbon-monoxide dehydrogenase catalytic subunit